jgi:hypothetical protein
VCYAYLGRTEKVKAEAAAMTEALPEIWSVEQAIEGMLVWFRNDEGKEHFLEGYRKAGLSE